MNLTGIYQTFHPNTHIGKYKFLWPPPGTICKTDDLLGHKANSNIHKKMKIKSQQIWLPLIRNGYQQNKKQQNVYKLLKSENLVLSEF